MNSLSDILDGIVALLTRYVVFPSKAAAVAVALWVVHTHAIQVADATPYLIVTSPEKRAGKTRLQEVLEHLVANPLRTTNATVSAIFRATAEGNLTLLFDEADAIFGRKVDGAEDLRGLLNAGHRRGATVLRCVGEGKGLESNASLSSPRSSSPPSAACPTRLRIAASPFGSSAKHRLKRWLAFAIGRSKPEVQTFVTRWPRCCPLTSFGTGDQCCRTTWTTVLRTAGSLS